MTHPVPDLTGYITEGQIVLSADVQARGIYPPVEPLASLSRLMRHGAGPGRTREDHLDLAAQVLAALARARKAHELAELLGAMSLSATDQSYLDFEQALETGLLHQGRDELRTLDETLDLAWAALGVLPAPRAGRAAAGDGRPPPSRGGGAMTGVPFDAPRPGRPGLAAAPPGSGPGVGLPAGAEAEGAA